MSEVYVVNAETFGACEYTGWNIHGVAAADGLNLAVGAGGLFRIFGDTDDGAAINGYIETGALAFGAETRQKWLVEARVYGRAPKGGRVTTVAYSSGNRKERVYGLRARGGAAARSMRVKPGRGVAAVAWGLRVANLNGGALEINALSVGFVLGKEVG